MSHVTLSLEQAAAFLQMSTSALREKVKSGQILAAKPAKRWVFLESDLVAYLRSLYPLPRKASSSSCAQEINLCHSTNATRPGGLASRRQTGSEYAALLELKIKSSHRNTTTD